MYREIELNHYYLSAKEYADLTGLGYQDVLYQCQKGSFDCLMTEGGQWRIKVNKNVSQKEFEQLKEENAKLKNTLGILNNILKQTIY